ncbi:MAG: hypothetical protein RMZ41_020975 [Nostoc sp. DedVER02]|uniref:hypothetical protein n=1 Tax=unclassified Nostoc TaxID=2593658 RepID=UPI002AD319A0|nr:MULTISPECIES: hypothetical protein [unclassified Nostoc]MDZ7986432.1 hypothetical protein [Nostoc sp. DedVER02]MDZ8114068.1 hypothetical protein [Nostoc sp. DedVER01b]
MSKYTSKSDNSLISELNLKTNVLVISGRLSATWAAWNAAVQGVIVVLLFNMFYQTQNNGKLYGVFSESVLE